MELRVPTERYLTFLTSLESEMASEGCGLSVREYVELIYHLRAVASYLRTPEETNSSRKEKKINAQENDGVGTTVHDPLTLKVTMKLMDLGRLPLFLLSREEGRIEFQC